MKVLFLQVPAVWKKGKNPLFFPNPLEKKAEVCYIYCVAKMHKNT